MKKIGFIGAGNMAEAIINGMLTSKNYLPKQIIATDINTQKLMQLKKSYAINSAESARAVVEMSDIVVLSVKPNIYPLIIKAIKKNINQNKLVVSIAAGIDLAYLEESFLPNARIVRTMPNLPVQTLSGMTSIAAGSHASDDDLKDVKMLFQSVGKALVISEKYIDAATALAGSSPAMVFMLIEAMADAGVLKGMPRDLAYTFAAQGVLGSAALVEQSKKHPAKLKDDVASPAGTTIEMIYSLEKDGFRGTVSKAMLACIDKASKIK